MNNKSTSKQKHSSLRIEFAPHAFDPAFPFIFDKLQRKEHGQVTYLHYHNALEIGYCHRGEGVIFCNDRIFPYHAGCVTLFLPGQVHFSQSRKGVVSIWTWTYCLQEELLHPFHDQLPALFNGPLQGKDRSPIIADSAKSENARLVSAIISEVHDKRPLYQSMVRCLFFELLCGIRRTHGEEKSGAQPGQDIHPAKHTLLARINPALQKMGEDYAGKLTIKDLAALCAMSEVNFRRLFITAIGQGPLEYLNNIRIAMSLSHLRNGDKSVSWIAAATGFPSVSSFNRQFKAVTKATPLHWRRQNQEQE
jgi:AraC-like DNA-binding protein